MVALKKNSQESSSITTSWNMNGSLLQKINRLSILGGTTLRVKPTHVRLEILRQNFLSKPVKSCTSSHCQADSLITYLKNCSNFQLRFSTTRFRIRQHWERNFGQSCCDKMMMWPMVWSSPTDNVTCCRLQRQSCWGELTVDLRGRYTLWSMRHNEYHHAVFHATKANYHWHRRRLTISKFFHEKIELPRTRCKRQKLKNNIISTVATSNIGVAMGPTPPNF